jgi:hypothetical protein
MRSLFLFLNKFGVDLVRCDYTRKRLLGVGLPSLLGMVGQIAKIVVFLEKKFIKIGFVAPWKPLKRLSTYV